MTIKDEGHPDHGWPPADSSGESAADSTRADDTAASTDGGLHEAARHYADLGLPVFPLGPCDKAPAIPNPHPKDSPERKECRGECGQYGHGLHDATTDPDEIDAWWLWENPAYNVGCTPQVGFVVIDIDPRHGGDVEFKKLVEAHGDLPKTWVAQTGTGGWHYWFTTTVTEIRGKLCEGVDLKGLGTGYVVMPPSIHPNGVRYRWLVPPDGPPAPAPAWLEDLMRKPPPPPPPPPGSVRFSTAGLDDPYVAKAVDDELAKLAACPDGGGQWGGRNWHLNNSALKLARFAGVDRVWLRGQLVEAMTANGYVASDGLAKVNNTIDSAFGEADRSGPRAIPEREHRAIAPAYTIDPAQASGDAESRFLPLLLTRTALRKLPDPAPLIGGVLDQATVALLYGPWGAGKSFIAQDWGWSVATGRPWQGRATEKRRVLYVAAEGAYGLKGRVEAWEKGWHVEVTDADFEVLPRPVNLTNTADVLQLTALVAMRGYGLVILDTLARCMVGADENSAKDCGQVVDALTRLREVTPDGRGTILGVHHTGKDGRTFRGSSVFEAGADTVYSVTTDGRAIILDRQKRKDGPPVDRHELRLDPVEETDSMILAVHSDSGLIRADRAAGLLSVFLQHFAETGASKAELRLVAEMPPSTFHRVLGDLLKRGDLTNHGTEKRPFYKATGQ